MCLPDQLIKIYPLYERLLFCYYLLEVPKIYILGWMGSYSGLKANGFALNGQIRKIILKTEGSHSGFGVKEFTPNGLLLKINFQNGGVA